MPRKLFKNGLGKYQPPGVCVNPKTKRKRDEESDVEDADPGNKPDLLSELGVTMDTVNQLKSCLLSDECSDDDDDEDNDVDGSDKAQSSDDEEDMEDDGDEDEDEDEDGDGDADEEFRERVRLALGPAAISDPDGSDLEVDDDEMFQLDKALGEAFRSKFGADKEQQIYEKEQRIVRLNAINLVKRFFRAKEATHLMVLHLINALLDAYKTYSGPNEKKIRKRVVKSFVQLQPVRYYESCDTLEAEFIERSFKKALDLSWKIEDKDLHTACAKVCRWSIALCHFATLERDWIQKEIKKLTHDFFTKPNCCLSKQFMINLLPNEKVMSSSLIGTLLSQIFSPIRPFKRLTGISLLFFCIKNLSTVSDEIKESLRTIQADVIRGLLEAVSNAKGPFINEWLQLLYIISKHVPLDIREDQIKILAGLPKKLKRKLYKPSKLCLRSIVNPCQTAPSRKLKKKKDLDILYKNQNQKSSPTKPCITQSCAPLDKKPKHIRDNPNVVESTSSPKKAPVKTVATDKPIIDNSASHLEKPKSPRKKLIIERLSPVSSPQKVSLTKKDQVQYSKGSESSQEKIENQLRPEKESLGTNQSEKNTKQSPPSSPKKSTNRPKNLPDNNSIVKLLSKSLPAEQKGDKNIEKILDNDNTGSPGTTVSSQDSGEFSPIPIPRVLITPKKGFNDRAFTFS